MGTRLQAAHATGRLSHELARLRRYGLIVVDEVGYIPFEQDAANPFFQLASSRCEHASLILTSNLPFARWGDVFGDQPAELSTSADSSGKGPTQPQCEPTRRVPGSADGRPA